MIRHTISVRADAIHRQADLSCCLPGFQDGDCIKLSQGDNCVYLTYRLSEKMGEKLTALGMQLMQLNNIEEGDCIAEQQKSNKIEHLLVRVSNLDWKIVNANQMVIAQSFLEQVHFVWPGAALPIYYDSFNFVTLRPLCQGVGQLDINSTVQFLEEEEKEDEGQASSIEQNQEQQYEQFMSLKNYCDHEDGYLNVVKVDKLAFKAIGKEEPQILWIVENQVQFINCPSIQEFLDLQKQREGDNAEPSNKKLVILIEDYEGLLSPSQFKCSKLSKHIVGLSDSLRLSNSKQNLPALDVLSLEVFLNDPNLVIRVEEIIKHQKLYTEDQFEEASQRVITNFSKTIIDLLYQKGSFYILQNSYPYCLAKSLFLLSLENKKQTESGKNYEIKLMDTKDTSKQTFFYQKLLQEKILFSSSKFPSSTPSTLEKRYQDINQWAQVVRQHFQQQLAKQKQQSLEESMTIMFKSIYQPQIDKVMNFIANQQQQCCLITSFGSNGKSFLHRILEMEGEKMWKINFRELSDPNLSFANIDLYLHWVFSSSPYSTIFLDDLDALCSKIEDSDQHKKKEKVISKLLIRVIQHYATTYSKRIICTARSESSLDEQFKPNSIILLKNPNRQQRQASLKELYIVVEPDESPIHKVKNKMGPSRRITHQTLDEIANSTESLTLAAFSSHAINLTQPTSTAPSSQFNFSKLAGLAPAKSAIKSMIEKPIKYSFLFKSVPIKLPRGMLLYGGTGNGKSALGTALKDEFKMKYFSVKGSDILSKYIGGSEAAVRDIFEKALSVSPSIIFFDQFESIVPKRSANNTGVNDRIVNQFLCYLDGVSSISGVYIVAASSRPDLIDPAVLRPGRLDSHLFLDYPSPDQRRELIQLFSHSVRIEVNEQDIVSATENFSYSDLIGLLKQLRIKRSAEVLKQEDYSSSQFTKISEELFKKILKQMKLSVSPADQLRQKKIFEAFREGRAPDIKQQRQIQQ